MIVAGVDYSLTCPAMCVFDTEDGEFNFEKCQFYYLTHDTMVYQISSLTDCQRQTKTAMYSQKDILWDQRVESLTLQKMLAF